MSHHLAPPLPSGSTSAAASTSASTASSASFTLPPLFSFPPFFTLQPHSATLATQLAQWSALVLAWAAHHRVFFLDSEASSSTTTSASGGAEADAERTLWSNPSLPRSLDRAARQRVLEHLVSAGRAAWDSPARAGAGKASKASATPPSTRVLLFWRRPEEWAESIYGWVEATGQNRSILTFFEITRGDAAEGQDFEGLPTQMLRRALDVLVKRGKAQVLFGTEGEEGDGGEGGVKFL